MAARRKKRTLGCLGALAVAAAAAAGAIYLFPEVKGALTGAIQQTVSDSVSQTQEYTAAEQMTEIPEVDVTEQETEGDFYYCKLSQNEQTVYRQLFQGTKDMEKNIVVSAGKGEHPEKVYEYLLYDHPELFWCSGSSQMTVYSTYTEFSPGYTCTRNEKEERQSQIDAAAGEILSKAALYQTEYEKIRYVYEAVIRSVDYDENAPDNQNIYSALVGKRSVCAGYSRTAQYLLQQMGVECIYVVGTAQNQQSHAWNIVNCGGKYYQLDVTFGDPVFLSSESGEDLPQDIIYYDYLCCTDDEILKDHTPDPDIVYPACTSDDLDYYKLTGMYYESYDPEQILSAMNASIYNGDEIFVCKFKDYQVYDMAVKSMADDLLPQAAQTLASVYDLEKVKYSYVADDTHNKMMVFWNYE